LAAIPGSEKEDEEMKKLGAGKDKNGYWIWYEQKQVHFAIKGGLENNDDHREMKIKQIISFFAKMKAKHVAEKTISKIFDHGYDTLGKIFDLKVEDISGEIEGFKEKSSGRFVDAVQSCIRDANMAKVAAASGVFGENIGEKKLEKIFQADKNILDSESSQEKLIDFIQNLGGIKTLAPQIASNFKKFKLWIRNHPQITFAVSDSSSDEDDQDDDDDQEEKEKEKKVVKKTDKKKTTKKKKKEEESEDEETESDEDSVDEKKVEKKEKKMTASSSSSSSSTPVTGIVNELKKKKPLLGKNICFTGARDQLLITTTIKLGAKIVDSVSKKLSYLVIGKKPGPSKVAKAEDLELQIITVENFKILISNFSK
jgi:NAD-dependent DNA ligase